MTRVGGGVSLSGGYIVCLFFKRIVYPKIIILSSFIHHHVVSKPFENFRQMSELLSSIFIWK